MAGDVSVHVKGSQSVTKPVNEALDSIHNLKEKCKEISQPMRDLTSAFNLLAGGAAAVVAVKFYHELASWESAFEKLHPEIAKTAGSATSLVASTTDLKGAFGNLINAGLSPTRSWLQGIFEDMTNNINAIADYKRAMYNMDAGVGTQNDRLTVLYKQWSDLKALIAETSEMWWSPIYTGEVPAALVIQKQALEAQIRGIEVELNADKLSIISNKVTAKEIYLPGGVAPSTEQFLEAYLKPYQMITESLFKGDAVAHSAEYLTKALNATAKAAENATPIFPMAPVDFTQMPGVLPTVPFEQILPTGSLGSDTQSFDMLGAAFGNLTSATGLLTAIFGSASQHISSFARLVNIVDDVMGVMFEILEPAINDILNPLLDVLRIVFYVIGQFLLPAYQVLAPVIKAVADGLVWFYNTIIVPVGNMILNCIWLVVDFISWIVKTVESWLHGQAGPLFENSVIWGSHPGLQPMVYTPGGGYAPAGGWPEGTTGETGDTYTGVTTVQQPPDIYLTINIYGNVLGEGGKATLGGEVVEAIEAHIGTGAHVSFLNN
jgi:phage-related protein